MTRAQTSTASKLGTRLAVFAMLATAAGFVTARVATGATSAAHTATVAGTGRLGFGGDSKTATAATLASPAGVAIDATGNVFIADTGNCRIREVFREATTALSANANDQMSTVAGSTCGDSGDGGSATRAQLSFPADVAVDSHGDLIIADTGNDRIRMVSARTHDISTIAGNGTAGFAGDGARANQAELDGPSSIALDAAGDLFVADTNNCRVREVPAVSGAHFGITMTAGDIYTVAGTGTCGSTSTGHAATATELWTPQGVAVDANGNLLVADTGNRFVREVAAVAGTNFGVAMTPGNIYTVAGSGTYNPYFGDGLPAASDAAALSFPTGLALDAAGNLFVSDTYGRSVREIAATNNTEFDLSAQATDMYTIAGAGPAESPTAGGSPTSHLVYPVGVALDRRGNAFVADIANNTVVEITSGNTS